MESKLELFENSALAALGSEIMSIAVHKMANDDDSKEGLSKALVDVYVSNMILQNELGLQKEEFIKACNERIETLYNKKTPPEEKDA